MNTVSKKARLKNGWFCAVLLVLGMALAGCGAEGDSGSEKANDEKANVKTSEKEANESKALPPTSQEEFASYADSISTFTKEATVTDNVGHITFFGSFAEYQTAKPNSTIGEKEYLDYFATGDKIEKMFTSDSVRLLRTFPSLTAVSLTLPFDGKTYSILLEREKVNEYLGFNVEDLSSEDGSWTSKFVDPIVYNDEKRQQFFQEFVAVQ